MASSAAILAIGKPVALLASAERARDARVHLDHGHAGRSSGPPRTGCSSRRSRRPTSRMIARAALRMAWYSRSVRVCAGATVTESPVWMPMGSKFSIEQMTTKLSALVAHHLELVLLPAEHGLLDQDLVHGREVEPARHDLLELLDVVGDAAAGAAEREGGPDDRGQARQLQHRARLVERRARSRSCGTSRPMRPMASLKSRRSSPTSTARRLAPIRRTPSRSSTPRRDSSTARLSAVWPPTVGSTRVGPLALEDRLEHLGRERLDVGAVRVLGVGHDRRRVRVHQRDAEALLLEDLDRLGARVVELAGLADHDRARSRSPGPSGSMASLGIR